MIRFESPPFRHTPFPRQVLHFTVNFVLPLQVAHFPDPLHWVHLENPKDRSPVIPLPLQVEQTPSLHFLQTSSSEPTPLHALHNASFRIISSITFPRAGEDFFSLSAYAVFPFVSAQK